MFASFAEGEEAFVKLMNGITGTAVCLMVLGLGIQGVCYSNQEINLLKGGNQDDNDFC